MEGSCIWFKAPARVWNAALPLGNGRLGAMVFGGTHVERLELNHESVWARVPAAHQNPRAFENLARVRELIMSGRPDRAEALANAFLMGSPNKVQPYQQLASMSLHFDLPAGDPGGYRRKLGLSDAMAVTEFDAGGVRHSREIWVSAPDDVLAGVFSSDVPGSVTFCAEIGRLADACCEIRDGMLCLDGRAGEHGTRFSVIAMFRNIGGSLEEGGGKIWIENADAVEMLVSCGTDFSGADPHEEATRILHAAREKCFDDLRNSHKASHRELFGRVSLDIGGDLGSSALPTDERLQRVKDGSEDPGLLKTCFDFGRYLLISSSRPHPDGNTLPANLQGIWNNQLTPPWNSDFHTNINVQMNYWPACTCNLVECQEPLFRWMDSLASDGEKTARVHYGCRGWVAHHISDPWGFSVPGDGAGCGLWPTGGAWLCDHLWEHYLFTGDRGFLQKAWPLIAGACRFFLDYLFEDESGRLLCGPSVSPENRYRLPDGIEGKLCMNATMDTQIIRELFLHALDAAAVLGIEDALTEGVRGVIPKLPPERIGSDGRLLEWAEEYEEPEPGHRHISHLWGVFPGTSISLSGTPELAEACKKVIDGRLGCGGGHTGWSAAWLVNLFAHLGDGEGAHSMLLKMLRESTLPNLFDDHPPFQIDGNFGMTSGVAEMLVQSAPGVIRLLPALPAAWARGSFSGLRARGNIIVGASWENNSLCSLSLCSAVAQELCLATGAGADSAEILLEAGVALELDNERLAELGLT